MIATLAVKPNERSTAIVTMSFKDEDNNAATPSNLQWQLMQTNGTVVNERSFEDCSFSADGGSAEIVLSGDDLAMFGAYDSGHRVFSVQGEYDSNAGTGLPITGEAVFQIQKLLGQMDK